MSSKPKKDLHVVLVAPEIHWNTGNTGRTCLAAGAQLHLVEPLGFSLSAKQVRRSGLDYWPRVDPQVWPDWATFEAELPNLGTPYFVTPNAPKTYWQAEYEGPVVLLFGTESSGFSDDIRAKYRAQSVDLPMQDEGLRSVNVSTCAGIVMYEVLRQRALSRP